MIELLKKYAFALAVLTGLVFLVACANMASPSGGDYDLDPPKLVRSNPKLNELHVKGKKLVLEFDENVMVDKPNEKVIVTPPQRSLPKIMAVNRKIYVELKDSLIENTTYIVDFTDAIADNNENNPLENFSLSFSTGDKIDSLCISGTVLDASNLEPVKGMYVGIHSNLEDSAFTKDKFLRISRTNEYGVFTIRGIAEGTYRLYALDDKNRDYMYDNPSEAIAFYDKLVVPSSMPATRFDTVYNKLDSAKIDTITSQGYTRFLPDDVVLRSFASAFKRKYLQSHSREARKINLFFGAPTQLPKIVPMSFDADKEWGILEKSAKNDTLSYWITDPEIMKMDSLKFEVTYLKTDSLNQDILTTDTLQFVNRERKKTEKELKREEEKKKKDEEEGKEPAMKYLNIKNNASGAWDVYRNITLELEEPIIDSLRHKIRLSQKADTIYRDIDFRLTRDTLNPRLYVLRHQWKYGEEYKLAIDSAAIHSVYGLWNNKLEQTFKVKKEDEYGRLLVRLNGMEPNTPAFVELLDKSDKPIRKSRVQDNVVVFFNLNPGDYYMRVTMDANGNNNWDTGDYDKKLQPEMVYYNNKYVTVRAFGELEQDWAISTDDLPKQKPLDITKNKPQKKETKRQQLEREEAKRKESKQGNQSGSRNTNMSGDSPYNQGGAYNNQGGGYNNNYNNNNNNNNY